MGPTHKRTEGRAPVWGSEFTTKKRYPTGPGGKQKWYYWLGVKELARCVGAACEVRIARRQLRGAICAARCTRPTVVPHAILDGALGCLFHPGLQRNAAEPALCGSSEKEHVGERKELRDLQTRTTKGNEVTREVGQEQKMRARTKKYARSPRGSTSPRACDPPRRTKPCRASRGSCG